MLEKPYERRLREYREAKQKIKQPKTKRVQSASEITAQKEKIDCILPALLGEKIPGSRFFRAFCARCNEPMRVDLAALRGGDVYCQECDPPKLTHIAATKDDISPWQENAIRAMEG